MKNSSELQKALSIISARHSGVKTLDSKEPEVKADRAQFVFLSHCKKVTDLNLNRSVLEKYRLGCQDRIGLYEKHRNSIYSNKSLSKETRKELLRELRTVSRPDEARFLLRVLNYILDDQ